MIYQLQDEIDDDGALDGEVNGCDNWEDEDDDWVDVVDAHDPYDIEYDR